MLETNWQNFVKDGRAGASSNAPTIFPFNLDSRPLVKKSSSGRSPYRRQQVGATGLVIYMLRLHSYRTGVCLRALRKRMREYTTTETAEEEK